MATAAVRPLSAPTLPSPVQTAAPQTARVTPQEAAAALRAALVLFARWGLTDGQARTLLGQPSPSTFYRWKRGDVGVLPADTVWRLGDLMGIHKSLRFMFTEAARGDDWIRRPNAAFGGASALARMLAGAPSDVASVRAYLDAERAGW